ncbi:MAG TPA: hypothetical protein VGP43_08105 [Chitinophagaceae bacterium]|nr:hypothetical protein [Chitinophagaceae bacterium]
MRCLLILILLFPLTTFAQITITGIIANSNRTVLPLTNIVALRKNVGSITNEKGEFTLSNLLKEDTIKVSNIAFYSKLIAVKDWVNDDTIFLLNNVKQLQQIVIKNFKGFKNEINLGFFDYSNNGEFKLAPGNQIALFISNNTNKEGWIKGVSFKVKQFGKCKNSMRVRLIQKDTLQFIPSVDILDENIVINYHDLKKSNYIDLSSYKLTMPKEGIFVIFEWLNPELNCDMASYTSISATLSNPTNIVWFNYRDRVWNKIYRPRLPNGNYMTPNISLRVAYN